MLYVVKLDLSFGLLVCEAHKNGCSSLVSFLDVYFSVVFQVLECFVFCGRQIILPGWMENEECGV